MSQRIKNVSEDNLRLICGFIRNLSKVSEGITDDSIASNTTFSSFYINELLNKLDENLKEYVLNEICTKLNGATYKIVSTTSEVVSTNYLYLIANASNSYDVYILESDQTTVTKIGTTNISVNLEIDPVTHNWIQDGIDSGVCAKGETLQENANNTDDVYQLDIVDGAGNIKITTPNLHGKNANIEENPNNDTDNFRLDITKANGDIVTTPNLMAHDEVSVPLNGFFKIYVEGGQLKLMCEDGATPPPLRVKNGELQYVVGGTIEYTNVEYGV